MFEDVVRLHGLQWFLAKPKHWRITLIRQPWILPIAAMHLAAVTVQRAWRPCWLRTFARGLVPRSLVSDQRSGVQLDCWTSESSGSPGRRRRAKEAMRKRYLMLLRRHGERSHAVITANLSPISMYASYESYCAAIIQSMWKARRSRLQFLRTIVFYKKLVLYNVAAYEIQREWRQHHRRVEERRCREQHHLVWTSNFLMDHAHSASTKLQRTWRRTCDYRTYRSLREVICGFQSSGDPCLLIRTLLPREALYLDPALQIHLRFRLGGSRFPPTIYYKVYTHAPVCDIGAFAPRNYAAENAQKSINEDNWYLRVENNGWRPMVHRPHHQPDEVEKTSAKKVLRNFHYSRLRRRQTIEKQRRRKTVEWMRKLYGMHLNTTVSEDGAVQQGAGSCAVATATGTSEDTVLQSHKFVGHSPSPQPPPEPPPLRCVEGDQCGHVAQETPNPLLSSHLASSSRSPLGSVRSQALSSRSSGGEKRRLILDQQFDTRPGSGSVHSHLADRLLDDADVSIQESDLFHRVGAEMSDDALLQWSQRLDFNAYIDTWQRIATSGLSEGNLPIARRIPLH
mmetsp:Transcript_14414/g.39370  ORF Transcript_14414/g.39370 Transcript_14414/m.39370 type:complete len:567 (-) Transcript_14414:93-1793(-)